MKRRRLNFLKIVLRGLIVLPAYLSYVIRNIIDFIDNKINLTTYKILQKFKLNEIERVDLDKNKKHFT